ncbi:hypothetical protein AAL_04073 [Moelleriella libera RCEF 2490]|uniref:Uncharacterized protein n=1 Tax=Moelleriella libera RCEF 2490 TaxID=1081109 RepID=A0A168CP09_9HYPO|nr:hypothetical protein AAL_04073 [Moelleriella libera RCEF 2490]
MGWVRPEKLARRRTTTTARRPFTLHPPADNFVSRRHLPLRIAHVVPARAAQAARPGAAACRGELTANCPVRLLCLSEFRLVPAAVWWEGGDEVVPPVALPGVACGRLASLRSKAPCCFCRDCHSSCLAEQWCAVFASGGPTGGCLRQAGLAPLESTSSLSERRANMARLPRFARRDQPGPIPLGPLAARLRGARQRVRLVDIQLPEDVVADRVVDAVRAADQRARARAARPRHLLQAPDPVDPRAHEPDAGPHRHLLHRQGQPRVGHDALHQPPARGAVALRDERVEPDDARGRVGGLAGWGGPLPRAPGGPAA